MATIHQAKAALRKKLADDLVYIKRMKDPATATREYNEALRWLDHLFKTADEALQAAQIQAQLLTVDPETLDNNIKAGDVAYYRDAWGKDTA